jgi:archaellum component FlaC
MANDSKEKLDTLKHDTKDVASEVKHRAQAAGEHVKRSVEGDTMPMGDRIVSNVKETVHKTQADIDAAKRDVRHGATNADDKV